MKGKLVGFDFELNTITIQFENLDDVEISMRDVEVSGLGFRPITEVVSDKLNEKFESLQFED